MIGQDCSSIVPLWKSTLKLTFFQRRDFRSGNNEEYAYDRLDQHHVTILKVQNTASREKDMISLEEHNVHGPETEMKNHQ